MSDGPVVGVVADVRDAGLNQDTGPVIYTSYYQGSTSATPAGLVVRTAGDPRSTIQMIKQAVWAVDPGQPLSSVVLLADFLRASLAEEQLDAHRTAGCIDRQTQPRPPAAVCRTGNGGQSLLLRNGQPEESLADRHRPRYERHQAFVCEPGLA